MFNLNILFPWKKKRVLEEISSELKKKYNKEVISYDFTHLDSKLVALYVSLEDDTPLYITARPDDVSGSMTVCEDMSF